MLFYWVYQFITEMMYSCFWLILDEYSTMFNIYSTVLPQMGLYVLTFVLLCP